MDVKDLTLAHVKSHLQVRLADKHSFSSHLHFTENQKRTHTPLLNTTQARSLSLSEGVGCGEDFVYPCGTEADECSE